MEFRQAGRSSGIGMLDIDKIHRIRSESIPSHQWDYGYTGHEDDHCMVMCDCDGSERELSCFSHKVTVCPHCGAGYWSELVAYRVPRSLVEDLREDEKR